MALLLKEKINRHAASFLRVYFALCLRLNYFSLHNLNSPHPVEKGFQVQGHTSVRQQS